MTVEANRTGGQLAMVRFPFAEAAGLTAEEGTESGTEDKHDGDKADLHIIILA